MIISVSIEFSHDLSDDEVKLYEELKNLSRDDVRKEFWIWEAKINEIFSSIQGEGPVVGYKTIIYKILRL